MLLRRMFVLRIYGIACVYDNMNDPPHKLVNILHSSQQPVKLINLPVLHIYFENMRNEDMKETEPAKAEADFSAKKRQYDILDFSPCGAGKLLHIFLSCSTLQVTNRLIMSLRRQLYPAEQEATAY